MSSWLAPAGPRPALRHGEHAPYQSCSRRTSTRSAQALSRACRDLAAMPQASPSSSTALSAKWLELLREIAPGLTRAAVVRDAEGSAGIGQWAVIQAAAGPLGVELTPIDPRESARCSAPSDGSRANRQRRLDRGSQLGGVEPPRADRRARDAPQLPAVYPYRSLRCERRPDLLWSRFDRPLPARGGLRRSHPQGREASRPAGAGTRPSSSWSSTSRPPKRSASTCRRPLLARADEVIE